MSNIADQMRDAVLCVEPIETYDEQVQRVTNCAANGGTITTSSIEPEQIPIPKTVQLPSTNGTVDADSINPGEAAVPILPQKDAPQVPGEKNKIISWVQDNPVLAGGAALALFLLLKKRR